MKGPEFLKQRFNLHAAPEVAKAAERTKSRTGEKVSQEPVDRIQNYLDRFKEIIERENEQDRERGLRSLKKVLYDAFIIHQEDIPESYFRLQQQIAREQGHGEIQITREMRKEAVRVIREDQRVSLDEWIDYLASDDALYPDWTKYWAFRSLVGMSLYDKEKLQFGSRSKHTTAKFPDLNREALAFVVDLIEKQTKGEHIQNPVEEGANVHAQEGKLVSDEEFQSLLSTQNFAKYYAFAIEHIVADNTELFKNINGEWKIFKRGSSADELVKSIQGHGTGWCTAGEYTARAQLQVGDFHTYFSNNAHGVPTIPRLAIRMEGEHIAEVRGVAHHQEIDPYISPVLEQKLLDFGPQGNEYRQKAADMKLLTVIDSKSKNNEPLTRDDIFFLYEIDHPIRGFGYREDPRVKELLKGRNRFEDAKVIVDADNDVDCILKLARLKGHESDLRRAVSKLISMRSGSEEGDSHDFDKNLESLILPQLDRMKGLDDDLVLAFLRMRMPRLIQKANGSFAFNDKFRLLTALHSYDKKHNSVQFQRIAGHVLKDASEAERISIVDTHPSSDKEIVKKLLQGVALIPRRTVKSLIASDHTDLVSAAIRRCENKLDSEVALALIQDGYIDTVVRNLSRFHALNTDVFNELLEKGYADTMRRHKGSFDYRMEMNPFGEYIINDPFKS